uniref:acyl-CoA dehydrogenase family protein n=3 Tax=Mycobacteriaceae TaxID=1762 RepID=UPI00111C25C0
MNLNSPWRTSELDAVRELAAKFCATELAPHRERFAQQHHVDRALWHRAGDLGLLCMSIPVEYGGGGGTFAHEAVLLEEQARIADSSWGAGLHSGIAAHYVLQYAQEELKQRWLP